MFDSPDAGGGDQFVNAEHCDELLAINVKGIELGVDTENGMADVIVADVTVINPDGTIGEQYRDTYLFGKVLFGQLKRKEGRTVLGIFRGEPGVKVKGKNVPYTLDPADEHATALAVRAMSTTPEPATVASGGGDDAPPWARK